MVTIKMTKEQNEWLLRRLKLDWDEEINYQYSNSSIDTSYLEELLDVYIAILGQPKGMIDVVVNNEIEQQMRQELDELKAYNDKNA